MTVKFQFVGQFPKYVILSEAVQSTAKSKDLGTYFTANVIIMRRFFDSALRAPLRMTCSKVLCNSLINCNFLRGTVRHNTGQPENKMKRRYAENGYKMTQ